MSCRLVRHCMLLFSIAVLLVACTQAQPSPDAEPAAATVAPTSVPTPTLTATPVPVVLDKTLRIEQAGFSVRYPADWHTRELTGTVALAADEAALDAQISGDSLVVFIDATPLDAIADEHGSAVVADVPAFFDFVSAAPRDVGYTPGATRPITVDGESGLEAVLDAEGSTGRLVALMTDSHGVRVLGQASQATWETQSPIFEAIVDSLNFFAPPEPATPTVGNQVTQPVLTTNGPPGFVLRIGGNAGPEGGRFVSARGLAVAPDGTVYLAESSQGVWVFQPDGTLIRAFGQDELLEAYDIAWGPEDTLYVADYGRNAIAQFDVEGNLLGRWGETGDAPDQFGLSSPQRIAVGADASVYALDSRISADGNNAVSSIVRFSGTDGSFIERIDLPSGSAPNDFTVDAEGNIYLAETFGSGVVKVDATGQEVARIGTTITAEDFTAGAIDLDDTGNIYVATWDNGVLQFAPDGAFIAQGGVAVSDSEKTPEPGEFQLPNGIAVAPDGTVWVSDNSGEYSAVTALQLSGDAEIQATAEALATAAATPIPEEALVRQWASRASASSAYQGYEAQNVTGPPDVEGCQDSMNAWASADPNGLETLEVRFDEPVFATEVHVYQNHQPGFITNVELIDEQGELTSVYKTAPQLQSECPVVLSVTFARTPERVVGVKLTIDQRPGANWNEIDAVELVGVE